MGQFFGQSDHAVSGSCADEGGSNAPSSAFFGRRRLPLQGAGARGFTLIELMVAVAVAAVLLAIAVPSFRSITISNKLNTSANDLIASLNTARMEAIKTNASAQFCSNSASVNTNGALGVKCGTQVGAVVSTNGSNATLVRSGPTSISGAIQFSGDVQALRYGGDGLARAVGQTTFYEGTIAKICSSSLDTNNIRTITMTGGSILVTTPSSGGCP